MTIDAVGPDKSCLLEADNEKAQKFMAIAMEHDLAVHPWTERLEIEFVSDRFNNAEVELQYLFCELKVDGIFAENVGLAKRVGAMRCETEAEKGITGAKTSASRLSAVMASPNEWFVAFSFLVAGVVVGALFTSFVMIRSSRRQIQLAASRMQLPIEDDESEIIQVQVVAPLIVN